MRQALKKKKNLPWQQLSEQVLFFAAKKKTFFSRWLSERIFHT